MFYDITDALSFFSCPSFPEFHRAVPLLQTCPVYEFVYDHTCFLFHLSNGYELLPLVGMPGFGKHPPFTCV
jgi:hypothetical protein